MFATKEEVLELLVHRTITADDASSPSVVTKGDVDNFCIIIDNRIKLKLKLAGVTDGEIADAVYQNGLREIARLMVVGIVESKFKAMWMGMKKAGN